MPPARAAHAATLAPPPQHAPDAPPSRLLSSQAQRDYFGAHTFERLGAPGVWEHANWTGTTGRVVASTYNA